MVLLAYLLLLGGTPSGTSNGIGQALNAIIAVALLLGWVARARRMSDRVDLLIVVALLLFLLAADLSFMPRQSFGSAMRAAGLAAGFAICRRLMAGGQRRIVEFIFGWGNLFLCAVILPQWIARWVNWLAATSWSAFPPLKIWLPVSPFANRHYIATLALLLLPAVWGNEFRSRWLYASWLATVGTAGLVFLDGSRTLAAAALGASIVVGILAVIRERRWGLPGPARGIALIGVAAAVAGGALAINTPVWERVANLQTLLARLSLWGDAISAWAIRPFQGLGPGTFPWSYFLDGHLQLTNYAPRHPDNAIAQLVAEAGVLGLAALVTLATAAIVGARGRVLQDLRAAWVLVVFAAACIGTNPSDLLFLTVPALLWAAMLIPAERSGEGPGLRYSRRGMRVISLAVSVPVVAAVLVTSAASLAYQVAWEAAVRGRSDIALSVVGLATTLDPTRPIYWRERGNLELANESYAPAESDYQRALALNPVDLEALSGLAVTAMNAGNYSEALELARQLSASRPYSASDQAVLALAEFHAKDTSAAYATLGQAILLDPGMATVSWTGTSLAAMDRTTALRAALRAMENPPPADIVGINGVLLTLMADGGDAESAAALAPGKLAHSARALAALSHCDTAGAVREIELARRSEVEQRAFWIASAVVATIARTPHAYDSRQVMTYLGYGDSQVPVTQSILAGDAESLWRYRLPAMLPVGGNSLLLPTGTLALIRYPRAVLQIDCTDGARRANAFLPAAFLEYPRLPEERRIGPRGPEVLH